jgi:two-component system chemotaxis sensor kinase CheA
LLLDPAAVASERSGLAETLKAIAAACGPQHSRLSDACKHALTKLVQEPEDKALTLLQQFASQALDYLVRPDQVKLLHEASSAPTPVSEVELSDSADPKFLVEFIEKHSTLMDDFEGALLDFLSAKEVLQGQELEEARSELQHFAKGYIHNVKGDAGSVGILGIERVCHFVEDLIVTQGVENLIGVLLSYKAWVLDAIKAISEQRPFPKSSAEFMKEFAEGAKETEPVIPVKSETVIKTNVDLSTLGPLGPEANLDLLAELMGQKPPSAQPAPPAPTVKQETPPPAATAPAPAPAPTGVPIGGDNSSYKLTGEVEIFNEFVAEAEDHLNNVESTVLEAGGNYSKDAIDAIFRSIHSIKGSSSYFGLKEMNESSHRTESILDQVRTGKREFDQGLTELVLVYLDLQRQLLERAKSALKTGSEIQRLAQCKDYLDRLEAYASGKTQEAPKAKAAEAAPAETDKKGEKLDVKTYIKVDIKRLDQLIDAIGEMGIYSSMLVQKCRQQLAGDEVTLKVTHQLEKFVRDLQNIGMSMRLVPIRGLFQKMSRLVWDLGKKVGKDIKFVMEGEDTELDRTIIDRLADPLMHMIRNALDHGVEPPDERERAGKPKQGRVKLLAYHANGNIHICIEDDGRGLDPEKLRRKAVEKGMIRPEQRLAPEEAYNLIFAAGFSTAAVVTDVSGRGVGMDVVKRNIETLRGRVHIRSAIGKGTAFTIELPLTLAIVEGIEVAVGQERLIIPVLSVVEFMRPSADMLHNTFDRGETFYFRGKYLPLYRLNELFGIGEARTNLQDTNVIVLETQGQQFAVAVDEIVGSYSTVIKSIGDIFGHSKGVAGCAIMSDGDIALILDVASLLTMAREVAPHPRRSLSETVPEADQNKIAA